MLSLGMIVGAAVMELVSVWKGVLMGAGLLWRKGNKTWQVAHPLMNSV